MLIYFNRQETIFALIFLSAEVIILSESFLIENIHKIMHIFILTNAASISLHMNIHV